MKILTDYQPVRPGRAPFELVEFERLTVTPYVNDKSRMAYSLRATGLKAAVARPRPRLRRRTRRDGPAAGARAGGARRRPVGGDVPGLPEPVAAAGHHHRPGRCWSP